MDWGTSAYADVQFTFPFRDRRFFDDDGVLLVIIFRKVGTPWPWWLYVMVTTLMALSRAITEWCLL